MGANDRDFFLYNDIIARLHKEKISDDKKKIEKNLSEHAWPKNPGLFSIQRESRLPQKTYITKSPGVQCDKGHASFDQACPLSVSKSPKRAGSRDELMVSCLPARAS